MTVVDRSLSVLKEIQEQLQSSKLQSASYRAGGYSVAGQEPLSRNKIKSGLIDSYYHSATLQSEDELPLRVELQHRALKAGIQPNPGNVYSPPVTMRNVDVGTVGSEESGGDFGSRNEKRNFPINVSPYKRKIVNKEHLSHLTERTSLRSREMVENIKKLISNEIEAFKKECDGIKKQIDNIRGAKSERASVEEISRKNSSSGIPEQTLKAITSKFDKLVDDIEDRIHGFSGSKKKLKERLSAANEQPYKEDSFERGYAPSRKSPNQKKKYQKYEYSFEDKRDDLSD